MSGSKEIDVYQGETLQGPRSEGVRVVGTQGRCGVESERKGLRDSPNDGSGTANDLGN